MKIKFLGTSAAEGIPALFCNCANCNYARKHGGKNIRTRFSILIDEDIKIDFPPDSYFHMIRYNLDYTKLKHILFTHDHNDHLCAQEFEYKTRVFTNIRDDKTNIYGNSVVIQKIMSEIDSEDCNYPILHPLNPFDTIETDKYLITVLKADHRSKGIALNYFFEDKITHKTFLCAHDTGYFLEETWNFLKNKTIDILSLDLTALVFPQVENHLGFNGMYLVKERLQLEGIIDENTKFIINHFSHNPQLNHEQIEEYVKNDSIIVCYDGMEVEI